MFGTGRPRSRTFDARLRVRSGLLKRRLASGRGAMKRGAVRVNTNVFVLLRNGGRNNVGRKRFVGKRKRHRMV